MIPIVFAFDNKYVLPASIAIKSLLTTKNKDTEYDIYVVHNDISEENQKKFEEIAKINWIKIDINKFKNFPISKNWPEVVYFRLLIPELINFDKIIYSDIDVLFNGDLTEVYNTDISEFYWGGIAAEKNTPNTVCHKYFPENKNEFIYMSGFMLINSKKMRDENIINKMFANIEKFNNRLKFFDLDILNLSCNKILSLPLKYCALINLYKADDITQALEYSFLSKIYNHDELIHACKQDPSIIHYAGTEKKIWKLEKKYIDKEYWDFIIQSPFYNSKDYSDNVTEKIFSIKNNIDKTHKILTIMGLKLKFRKTRSAVGGGVIPLFETYLFAA